MVSLGPILKEKKQRKKAEHSKGVTQVDIQNAIAKLKELTTNKDRRTRYIQHLQHQAVRLDRIARLLRVSPDEARECMELAVEYLLSEGILKKGMVRLPRKRIQGNIDNEVKMFLLKNGLCD